MKNKTKWVFFLWVFIVAVFAGGTFLIAKHFNLHPASAAQPDADMQMDVQSGGDVSDTASAAGGNATVPTKQFSGEGYAFSAPASWNVERTASDTIAVHPDAASPDAACKIEMSAFPYSPDEDASEWIAHRIGADPSLAVVERSSAEVSFASGTGVEWSGTIDSAPTTLVYAFNDAHAYEIAPSVVGGSSSNDPASCNDMLQEFLSTLTI